MAQTWCRRAFINASVIVIVINRVIFCIMNMYNNPRAPVFNHSVTFFLAPRYEQRTARRTRTLPKKSTHTVLAARLCISGASPFAILAATPNRCCTSSTRSVTIAQYPSPARPAAQTSIVAHAPAPRLKTLGTARR